MLSYLQLHCHLYTKKNASICMHAPAREKILFGDSNHPLLIYKSIHTNYNYKTYPSNGNIGTDRTARLHILISTFLFLICWKQVYCNVPVICNHAPPPTLTPALREQQVGKTMAAPPPRSLVRFKLHCHI